MIVDTHVHVTSLDEKTYPKVKDAYDWPTFPVEQYLAVMDEVGIDRALLVQPYFTYHYDNRYQADAALAHKDRFLCVAVIDQFAPDAAEMLSALVELHGVRGVRLMRNKGGGLRDPRLFPLWERAGALGIPICVAAQLDQLADARVPIERYPDVTVCLEHMWAQPMGDPPYPEFQPMWDMARFANVRLKITPNNAHQAQTGRGSPRDFFATLVERFGARRIMWGSNYPAHWDKYAGIPERLALMQRELAFLPEADRRWIFGEAALAVWPALR